MNHQDLSEQEIQRRDSLQNNVINKLHRQGQTHPIKGLLYKNLDTPKRAGVINKRT